MLQTFFTRRALKGRLSNRRALQGYLGTQGTGALEVLGHSGSRGTGHSKGTWGLSHLDTWALEAFYLADSFFECAFLMYVIYISTFNHFRNNNLEKELADLQTKMDSKMTELNVSSFLLVFCITFYICNFE